MSANNNNSVDSRFAASNPTPQQLLSHNTVGLVALSDFRKRRAELRDQQDREAASTSGSITPAAQSTPPNRSHTGTPVPTGPDNPSAPADPTATSAANPTGPPKKKKKTNTKSSAAKLSFGDDEDELNDGPALFPTKKAYKPPAGREPTKHTTDDIEDDDRANQDASAEQKAYKLKANTAVSIVPRPMTKAALRRETAERETLRKEFLARQEAVKAAEIAVPFVFYDGSNTPGGVVRVKKGDFIWVFLDKSRKVGAGLGTGRKIVRAWARVGVEDLIMVRGGVIIPHHYDFLYFIMNKTLGPNDTPLFGYSSEAPVPKHADDAEPDGATQLNVQYQPLSTAASKAAALPDIKTLEGASDDPTWTKVVDRRWYERNKHIYPASTWREFDPEKDYRQEVRRDLGGNTFFYS